MKHLLVRTTTVPGQPTVYHGICGATGENAKEYTHPLNSEWAKVTCPACLEKKQ